ncbi:hypothetical protein DFJ63DRAFT_20290 [Scheffersomyces coipomensis]|uniref:uncharacterized protein n=1 Tax=Scheffersomyces coipomensis TaxID=1788519 RepID=UPI00315DF2C7
MELTSSIPSLQPSSVTNHSSNIQISSQSSSSPIVVKTSKQWVLPPRPKPGRKPITSISTNASHSQSNSNSNSSVASPIVNNSSTTNSTSINANPEKKKKSSYTKKSLNSTNTNNNHSNNHINSQILSQSSHKSNKSTINPLISLSPSPNASSPSPSLILSNLNQNIKLIDSENLSLKSHLLSLIHDYKQLKNIVLDNTSNYYYYSNPTSTSNTNQTTSTSTPSLTPLTIDNNNAHKRSFNEQQLIDNEFDNYITIPSKKMNTNDDAMDVDEDELLDEVDELDNSDIEDEDLEHNSNSNSPSTCKLSRTSSPYSDDSENNSLMSTLTRSTTVSSSTSYFNDNSKLSNRSKLIDLPSFNSTQSSSITNPYQFKFDELMNQTHSHQKASSSDLFNQDQYNMITDFLEEKLINNDVKYYVENNNDLSNHGGAGNGSGSSNGDNNAW